MSRAISSNATGRSRLPDASNDTQRSPSSGGAQAHTRTEGTPGREPQSTRIQARLAAYSVHLGKGDEYLPGGGLFPSHYAKGAGRSWDEPSSAAAWTGANPAESALLSSAGLHRRSSGSSAGVRAVRSHPLRLHPLQDTVTGASLTTAQLKSHYALAWPDMRCVVGRSAAEDGLAWTTAWFDRGGALAATFDHELTRQSDSSLALKLEWVWIAPQYRGLGLADAVIERSARLLRAVSKHEGDQIKLAAGSAGSPLDSTVPSEKVGIYRWAKLGFEFDGPARARRDLEDEASDDESTADGVGVPAVQVPPAPRAPRPVIRSGLTTHALTPEHGDDLTDLRARWRTWVDQRVDEGLFPPDTREALKAAADAFKQPWDFAEFRVRGLAVPAGGTERPLGQAFLASDASPDRWFGTLFVNQPERTSSRLAAADYYATRGAQYLASAAARGSSPQQTAEAGRAAGGEIDIAVATELKRKALDPGNEPGFRFRAATMCIALATEGAPPHTDHSAHPIMREMVEALLDEHQAPVPAEGKDTSPDRANLLFYLGLSDPATFEAIRRSHIERSRDEALKQDVEMIADLIADAGE